MTDLLLVRGKGGRQAPVAVLASTQLVFAGSPGKRSGVYITAYAATVYVKFTNFSDANPTVSSTDYDLAIPANTTALFPWTASVGVWAQSAGNVSGVEVYA